MSGHKGRPRCSWERFLLKSFVAMAHLVGAPSKYIEWWMWEMTPIPFGFPSWRQYLKGARFLGKRTIR